MAFFRARLRLWDFGLDYWLYWPVPALEHRHSVRILVFRNISWHRTQKHLHNTYHQLVHVSLSVSCVTTYSNQFQTCEPNVELIILQLTKLLLFQPMKFECFFHHLHNVGKSSRRISKTFDSALTSRSCPVLYVWAGDVIGFLLKSTCPKSLEPYFPSSIDWPSWSPVLYHLNFAFWGLLKAVVVY